MLNLLTHSSFGFRPPSETGRGYGTLAQSHGGVLAQNPQAYCANSAVRIVALLPAVNAGVSARESLR